VLIIRRSKLYCTASGIVTPVGGRPVHRLGEDCSPLSTCAPDGHLHIVTIPDAVQYNFDLPMMITWCSKHVEVYNKLIKRTRIFALSWSIAKMILRNILHQLHIPGVPKNVYTF